MGSEKRRRDEHLIISYSCELFSRTLQGSTTLCLVIACFVGRILAMNFCLLAVETSQGHIIDHLLTFEHKETPQTYFPCSLHPLVYGFPLCCNKTLGEPLRDELMPLKYISVSWPLMVLFKNKGGGVRAAWFLLKFSFPLL